MQYRTMGNSGVDVSFISFGAMRYPDEAEAETILHRGIEQGLNYVDTSSGYVGGKSEIWVGRAVQDRRDQIHVSGKSKFNSAPNAEEVREIIDARLDATGLDCLDFFQLWGLQTQDTLDEALKPGGFVEGVRKAQSEGLIRKGLGFTFHGTPEVFRNAIDSGEFCAATVSYNLMNRKEEENIAYAGSKGVGIVIMNPLAGGMLALGGHEQLDFLCHGKHGPYYNTLRYLYADPNITTCIVGFSHAEEVDQAVAAIEGADGFDEAFREEMRQKIDAVNLLEGDFCTGCGYCKECPHGFNPTRFMKAMRDFYAYGVEEDRLKHWLESRYPHTNLPDHLAQCTECAECEGKCPQHLAIVDHIRRAKELFID